MRIKFLDSKNLIRLLIIDKETLESQIKENRKLGIDAYGDLFEKELQGFANTLSEEEVKSYYPELSDKKMMKYGKNNLIIGNIDLLEKYFNYLETNFVTAEDKVFIFYFDWDPQAIFNKDNRTNDPEKTSSISKYVSTGTIRAIAYDCGLKAPEDEIVKEEGRDILTLIGTKENFKNFFTRVADKFTEAEKLYSGSKGEGGKFTNYKTKELRAMKEKTDVEVAKIRKQIETNNEEIEALKGYIAENNEDLKDPTLDDDFKADIIAENNDNEREIKEYLEKNTKLEEKIVKLQEAYSGHTYTPEEVEEMCDYDNTGYTLTVKYMRDHKKAFDSKKPWFDIPNTSLKFNYENSILTCDGIEYNYSKVSDAIIKKYNDIKPQITLENWISGNPKLVKNIIEGLKEIDQKGEKQEMKDSLGNVKFKFNDGTIIEVVESDGKDFKTVKDEAIKVYKEFKEQIKSKEPTAVADEVAEETTAPAEEACEPTDALESAKIAFDKGMTVKEWYAEEGHKYFTEGTGLERKMTAIETWRCVKEAEVPAEDDLEKKEEEEWEEAYKTAGYQDTAECVEDSVEETEEAKYQVIVNGKEIGVFDTEEEAKEAEKKALDAIEKGIPKPEQE